MPQASRGRRRQAELVAAGVEILSESGWEGLTHRAVAARAEANPGLVHYYFKGSDGLRLAVAAQAARQSITALFDELLSVEPDAFPATLKRMLRAARDDRHAGRVTTALISASFDDPAIGALVREEFADGRSRVEQWLHTRHPSWSPARTRGAAALLVATIDSLALQLLLDPELPLDDIDATTRTLWRAMETDGPT
ncbi:TetR/AcrR family transcriptional regulator [Stackebrandtia nassauensis]|uniref:Transcriptional regulator, TetR family n=1 Tax=Stackebrandtia nassauensis (strain DSM 44728 / CIP 108903 / NRRL B-16338 / NBRC 102104 / LLR-40K-21) TaxID=446470 RepID=D3Q4G7_STANL|nr:TetR family transcriptional regulator [Stackebrandtia nassauensis]ADD40127.1 transcriptional regulator, TetR family [Stackebrandtia nassauensis DSM 44728]